MYDTVYSLSINDIRYIAYNIADIPITPVPEENRIHPMDRKFNKLIRDKQKLFKASVK